MDRKKKVYSLYKGDNEIAFGIVKEIANKIGVKEKTILFYTTPTYKKRVLKSKNRRELVVVEDEEY